MNAERNEEIAARGVAALCSRLLEALHAGEPGTALAGLLEVATQLLASADGAWTDVLLLRDGDAIAANDMPCNPLTTAHLSRTLEAHGVRSVVLAADTTKRELLQFLALLANPPHEATGAIATLWRAHGAWRIRLELEGETSARLIEGGAAQIAPDATSGETREQALSALLAVSTGDGPLPFDDPTSAVRVQLVAQLVGLGASFAPDQPVGTILRRAGADGTRVLLALLADASSVVERRRYFDAIASLQLGVPVLIEALQNPQWFVARNAALLLGELRARPADQAVARLLGHDDARVRLAATESLTALGTDIAFLALERATHDHNATVRAAAWSGLATSPDTPTIACLADGLANENDPVVQRALLACLAEHPHPMAVALLVRFCARLVTSVRHGAIVCDALELLIEYRPRSVQPFLRRLQDMESPAIRSRVEALQAQCAAVL